MGPFDQASDSVRRHVLDVEKFTMNIVPGLGSRQLRVMQRNFLAQICQDPDSNGYLVAAPGSGKTTSMVSVINSFALQKPFKERINVLVLVPTAELAANFLQDYLIRGHRANMNDNWVKVADVQHVQDLNNRRGQRSTGWADVSYDIRARMEKIKFYPTSFFPQFQKIAQAAAKSQAKPKKRAFSVLEMNYEEGLTVLVMTYASVRTFETACIFDLVIADEAHRIFNVTLQQTWKVSFGLLKACRFLAFSGTPVTCSLPRAGTAPLQLSMLMEWTRADALRAGDIVPTVVCLIQLCSPEFLFEGCDPSIKQRLVLAFRRECESSVLAEEVEGLEGQAMLHLAVTLHIFAFMVSQTHEAMEGISQCGTFVTMFLRLQRNHYCQALQTAIKSLRDMEPELSGQLLTRVRTLMTERSRSLTSEQLESIPLQEHLQRLEVFFPETPPARTDLIAKLSGDKCPSPRRPNSFSIYVGVDWLGLGVSPNVLDGTAEMPRTSASRSDVALNQFATRAARSAGVHKTHNRALFFIDHEPYISSHPRKRKLEEPDSEEAEVAVPEMPAASSEGSGEASHQEPPQDAGAQLDGQEEGGQSGQQSPSSPCLSESSEYGQMAALQSSCRGKPVNHLVALLAMALDGVSPEASACQMFCREDSREELQEIVESKKHIVKESMKSQTWHSMPSLKYRELGVLPEKHYAVVQLLSAPGGVAALVWQAATGPGTHTFKSEVKAQMLRFWPRNHSISEEELNVLVRQHCTGARTSFSLAETEGGITMAHNEQYVKIRQELETNKELDTNNLEEGATVVAKKVPAVTFVDEPIPVRVTSMKDVCTHHLLQDPALRQKAVGLGTCVSCLFMRFSGGIPHFSTEAKVPASQTFLFVELPWDHQRQLPADECKKRQKDAGEEFRKALQLSRSTRSARAALSAAALQPVPVKTGSYVLVVCNKTDTYHAVAIMAHGQNKKPCFQELLIESEVRDHIATEAAIRKVKACLMSCRAQEDQIWEVLAASDGTFSLKGGSHGLLNFENFQYGDASESYLLKKDCAGGAYFSAVAEAFECFPCGQLLCGGVPQGVRVAPKQGRKSCVFRSLTPSVQMSSMWMMVDASLFDGKEEVLAADRDELCEAFNRDRYSERGESVSVCT